MEGSGGGGRASDGLRHGHQPVALRDLLPPPHGHCHLHRRTQPLRVPQHTAHQEVAHRPLPRPLHRGHPGGLLQQLGPAPRLGQDLLPAVQLGHQEHQLALARHFALQWSRNFGKAETKGC